MRYFNQHIPLIVQIGLSFLLLLSGFDLQANIAVSSPQSVVAPSQNVGNGIPEKKLSLASDVQRIVDRGVLLVAMPKKDSPPFFAVNEAGEYWGLDVELARGLAEQLGVVAEFNRDAESHNAAVDRVAHGLSDIAICKLSRTFKRAMTVRFSNPYVVMRQGLLINRLVFAQQANDASSPEQAVQHLSGNLGVLANSSYVDFAQKYFKNTKVVQFQTWDEVIAAAAKGDVVAAYRDEFEVKKILKTQPETALMFKTAIISDASDAIAIAVGPNSTILWGLINVYLADQRIAVDMTAEKILEKYAQEMGVVKIK